MGTHDALYGNSMVYKLIKCTRRSSEDGEHVHFHSSQHKSHLQTWPELKKIPTQILFATGRR